MSALMKMDGSLTLLKAVHEMSTKDSRHEMVDVGGVTAPNDDLSQQIGNGMDRIRNFQLDLDEMEKTVQVRTVLVC